DPCGFSTRKTPTRDRLRAGRAEKRYGEPRPTVVARRTGTTGCVYRRDSAPFAVRRTRPDGSFLACRTTSRDAASPISPSAQTALRTTIESPLARSSVICSVIAAIAVGRFAHHHPAT